MNAPGAQKVAILKRIKQKIGHVMQDRPDEINLELVQLEISRLILLRFADTEIGL